MTARLALIWAEASGGVIGHDGGMPWELPEDLARFRSLTTGHAVIMGRKTWDAVPERFRPLPGRRNIVVTRQPEWRADGAERAASVDEALALLPHDATGWVIGGAELYAATIASAARLEVTEIAVAVAGDAFAPAVGAPWHPVSVDPPPGAGDGWHTSRTGLRYRYVSYARA